MRVNASLFENMRPPVVSIASQLCHYARFRLEGARINLKKGILVVSIDVDVGNKELGRINEGRNDRNVHDHLSESYIGSVEELAIPMFINLFDEFDVPVTFGIRGQWLEFPNPVLERILESSTKHDIGAHGYSHHSFAEMSENEADNELSVISSLMNRLGIAPNSFIFPKNKIAHVDLLEKHGYVCYRDRGDLFHDGLYIRKHDKLYDVHPSLYIDQSVKLFPLKRMLDVCINKRVPLHIWFHLWSFGTERDSIRNVLDKRLLPFLKYARKKTDDGELTFETMFSSTNRLQNSDVSAL